MSDTLMVGSTPGNLQPGSIVGEHNLLELLGVGGEGSVWSAWDNSTRRVVAIKFLLGGDEHHDAHVAFEREALIVSGLSHPNVLPLYEFGKARGLAYYSMRYVPAGSLHDLLDGDPLDPPVALRLAAQIASALDYIHARGVVHRDLKPRNVLLDTGGRAYLVDFGLAKQLSLSTQSFHTGRGTVPYSPPEQHTGSNLSPASDTYSFGVLLYEMFTGRLPWDGDPALAIMQLEKGAMLPDPRASNPQLPALLVDMLRLMTAATPESRPQSATHAFQLVAQSFDLPAPDSIATRNLGAPVSQNLVEDTLLRQTDAELTVVDATYLVEQAQAGWQPQLEPFALSLTDYALVDGVYVEAAQYGLQADARTMLRGALVHGHNVGYWWEQLSDSDERLAVCGETIAAEAEPAVVRTIEWMRQALPGVPQLATALDRLILFATDSLEPRLQAAALDLLNFVNEPEGDWKPVAFTSEGDRKLAALAASDGAYAERAARLIGRARSEQAVRAILEDQGAGATTRKLDALMTVQAAAGKLPGSVPLGTRLRVAAGLAYRQFVADRGALLRSYALAALGSALGMAFHVYAVSRVPSFLDARRILGALSAGVIFGLVIGLGSALVSEILERLRVLALPLRTALGIGAGTLLVNLGFVSYHTFFLDREVTGGAIFLGALVSAAGLALGARRSRSRLLRALICTSAFALALAVSWQLYLTVLVSPMLYYELAQPRQTLALMLETAFLMGGMPHLVRPGKVTPDVDLTRDRSG